MHRMVVDPEADGREMRVRAKFFLSLVCFIASLVAFACTGMAFLWSHPGRGRRPIFISATIAFFTTVAAFLSAFGVHFWLEFTFWIWVAIIAISVGLGVFIFLLMFDPLLLFVEVPALFLMFSSGVAMIVFVAVSEALNSEAFTFSSVATTVLAGVTYYYVNHVIEERKAIKIILLPFLSAVVRFRCTLSLFVDNHGLTSYYRVNPNKGASCFLFELFALMRAIEVKRTKAHYNMKLFAKLHDVCIDLKKKAAKIVNFSLQDFGVEEFETFGSSVKLMDLLLKFPSGDLDSSGKMELHAVFLHLSTCIKNEVITAVAIHEVTAVAIHEVTAAAIQEDREKLGKDLRRILISLDEILNYFGFNVENRDLIN